MTAMNIHMVIKAVGVLALLSTCARNVCYDEDRAHIGHSKYLK